MKEGDRDVCNKEEISTSYQRSAGGKHISKGTKHPGGFTDGNLWDLYSRSYMCNVPVFVFI